MFLNIKYISRALFYLWNTTIKSVLHKGPIPRLRAIQGRFGQICLDWLVVWEFVMFKYLMAMRRRIVFGLQKICCSFLFIWGKPIWGRICNFNIWSAVSHMIVSKALNAWVSSEVWTKTLTKLLFKCCSFLQCNRSASYSSLELSLFTQSTPIFTLWGITGLYTHVLKAFSGSCDNFM